MSADLAPLADRLMELYRRLYAVYGPQRWWPGESRFEVICGAILTQSAAWTNVEKALGNMRAACCWSFEAVGAISETELAGIIRPSGYFNAKAKKLMAFSGHVLHNYGGDLDRFFAKDTNALREELLSIHGIGEETADDILVYAAEQPSFVIDAYTRRVFDRMGLAPARTRPRYADYQALFHENLPPDVPLFNEFHALLDRHGKETCTKRAPRCGECCLSELCATGKAALS